MSDSVVEPPSPKRTKVDADSCDAPIVAAVSTAASDHVAPAAKTTADTSVEPSEVSEHPVSNGAVPDGTPTADAPAAIDDTTGEPLSKRARKKIAKLAAYQQNKLAKRHAERAKHRQRRAEAVARGDPPTGPSRKALKNNTRAASTNRHRICVDMDFDGLMIDKDVCKCAKQLLWVYTINRKAPAPAQLFYSGVRPGSRVQLALERNDGYRNWDIDIGEQSYMERFEAASIVYLTSDSDTVLTELSVDDVYVIGGLVDHNHHKGLTLARAQERGLRTARLPLGEHVRLKTRTVLTIVHVFDILLRVSMGDSWPDAILSVLPSRKGAIAKPDETPPTDDDDATNTDTEVKLQDDESTRERVDSAEHVDVDVTEAVKQ